MSGYGVRIYKVLKLAQFPDIELIDQYIFI